MTTESLRRSELYPTPEADALFRLAAALVELHPGRSHVEQAKEHSPDGLTAALCHTLRDMARHAPLVHETPVATGDPELPAETQAAEVLVWRDACIDRVVRLSHSLALPSTVELLSKRAVQRVADTALVELCRRSDRKRRRLEGRLLEPGRRLREDRVRDELTGLAGRPLVIERLTNALRPHPGARTHVAVLLIDLDRFGALNERFGLGVGDEVLVAVAERLVTAAGRAGTVGRHGADEFALVIESATDTGPDANALAAVVLAALAPPIAVGDLEISATLSVGVAVAGTGDSPDDLLSRADHALQRAKGEGGDRVARYDPVLDRRAARRSELAQELRAGLSAGQLQLTYQPIVGAGTPCMLGREAHIVWHHPVLGQLRGSDILPVAERAGFGDEIERFVLARACRDCATWRQTEGRHVGVSVNVSPRQLDVPGFAYHVEHVLATNGLEPHALTFEVAEAVLLESGSRINGALARLRSAGVKITVDHFGTGHSSLTWLARLPADAVKIDRSFVGALRPSGPDSVVVQAMVRLAHTLGIAAAADGVEREDQLEHLVRLGCDLVQGPLLGAPVSLGEPGGSA